VVTRDSGPPVLVPLRTVGGNLDNDDPAYVFAPDLYLALALAYDCLAAPAAHCDAGGVWAPDFTAMQPRLALRWEEQANGDWLVWLRPGVRSNRGNELTAADLAWVFDKAFAHTTLSSWRWRDVIGVEKIEIVDRHCLRYCLRTPYPTFPNWLLSLAPNVVDSTAIRRHVTDADPWGIAWLNANAAGFGAYEIDALEPDRIAFSRREDYWMGPAEPARIEGRVAPDRTSAIRLLDERTPVVIVGADPDETAALLKRDDLTVERTWAGHVSVEIDFTLPLFSDKRVRHALAFATPTDRLMREGLLGLARPWRSPVKGVSQWYEPAGWPYRTDPAHGRKLLGEAGYASGLASDFYVDVARADCRRMADIIVGAWREIGVELTVKDLALAPRGWLPPLHLRTECAHNLSEPIYDIVHDYAAMDPIFPLPGGPEHVGTWTPRWVKNEEAIAAIGAILLEPDREKKKQRTLALQAWLVDFSSSIFICEGQQTMIANRHVPRPLIAPQSHFFQALQYQNCTSNYLPGHGHRH
jgi:peptide/nickel transport system substrate-binding protein